MSAAQARAVRTLAEPIVSGFAADLEDVVVRQAGRRRIVRVVVDHDGGLSLDLVAEISRALSAALDDSDALGSAPYVLEVSSPGVDRPLTAQRHWRRAIGRLVEVALTSGAHVAGRVAAADADSATLATDAGERVVAFADVRRALVQVEFARADEAGFDAEGEAELEDAEADAEPGAEA